MGLLGDKKTSLKILKMSKSNFNLLYCSDFDRGKFHIKKILISIAVILVNELPATSVAPEVTRNL